MKKFTVSLILLLLIGSTGSFLKAVEEDPVLQKMLQVLKTYEQGIDDDLVLKLNEYIRKKRREKESRRACENELLLFLADDISAAAALEACRHLRILGSNRSVPVLTEMLLNKDSTDMARYVLEKIPGQEAQDALQQALEQSTGDIRLGLIASLGQRGDSGAVRLLGKLLSTPDIEAAKAAIRALGHIPDPQAEELLSRSLSTSFEPIKTETAAALINCAERYLRQKDNRSAVSFYNKVINSSVPIPMRQAAQQGKISASAGTAGQQILELLLAEDQDMYGPAIDMIGPGLEQTKIENICSILPRLPEQNQAQLLLRLIGFKGPEVFSAATTALKSESLLVRAAALNVLSRTGGTASIDLLVDFAVGAKGREQTAARTALWDLTGSDVDTEILSRLNQESRPKIRNELIQCIGERRIVMGKELLFKAALSEYSDNRISAVRALKYVAEPEDLPSMLSILEKLEQDFEQMEMVTTTAVVAGRIYKRDDRANAVEWVLEDTDNDRFRGVLLRILGKIGDNSSIDLVRNALQDSNQEIVDAAVRALADWPQVTARDDVLGIARTSDNPVHHVLALRAYVRLITSEDYRKPEGVVASLKEASDLSTRPEEKILILGHLPRFACSDGLKLAEFMLADKDVQAEAELAVIQIRRRLEQR